MYNVLGSYRRVTICSTSSCEIVLGSHPHSLHRKRITLDSPKDGVMQKIIPRIVVIHNPVLANRGQVIPISSTFSALDDLRNFAFL
jgi:hypothetical protein